MMTQRGLTASQPWMRADTHRGPEHNRSTSEAEYIDAALTFALSQLHLAPHGRAIHPGTPQPNRRQWKGQLSDVKPPKGARTSADCRPVGDIKLRLTPPCVHPDEMILGWVGQAMRILRVTWPLLSQ